MNEPWPKAILVDLDDTILDFSSHADPCWWDICRRFAPRIEACTAGELFASIKASRIWFWQDPTRLHWGRLDPTQARRTIVAQAFARLQVDAPELAEVIADTYASEREAPVQPFPGAIETLHYLRDQGVRLALLTNGQAAMQRRKIERFDLAPLFDCIVIEGEFGAGKPDERVFRHALAQLGAAPEEAWMVGDQLEWDVLGAQRVGILGIWVDACGGGPPKDAPEQPDRTIRSLSELVGRE